MHERRYLGGKKMSKNKGSLGHSEGPKMKVIS